MDPLRTILDTAPDAFVSMDESGRIVYWNVRAETVFGLTRAQAVGRMLAETIIPEGDRSGHRRRVREVLETGRAGWLGVRRDAAGLHADGSEFPVEITASAARGEDGWTFHAFVEDVSGQRRGEQDRAWSVGRLEQEFHRIETPFTGVVDSLAEAVTIRDRDDRIIYANRAALRSLGFASLDALRAAAPNAIMDEYIVTAEDGSQLHMADVPSVRLLHGEDPPAVLMHVVHRATGVAHWRLLKTTPLRGEHGEIEAAITIIEDLTSVKRAELETRLLAEASEILASSLDYEQTLRNVASLAVPGFADWCAVDLVGDRGDRIPVAVAHSDPAKLALAERLRAHEPEEVDPQRGVGRVFRTGQAELHPEITDAMLLAGARNAEHFALLREVGMSSAMIVPLRTAGRTIGALSLINAESHRRFDREALTVAQQIADRAATAVENSRLYTSRSEIAATLQRSLLPEELPQIDGWELAALYRAAGEGMEVGGDFYDVFPVAGGWVVLIGDVTGKGVAAAAMTSLVRHSARVIAEDRSSPEAILRRLDATLRGQGQLSLCSVLCVRISEAGVTIGSAGHPLPLLIGGDGSLGSVGEPGSLLGAFDDADWPQTTIAVDPGDALLLYTDGVTDTVGADGRLGDGGLRRLAAEVAGQPACELLAGLDRRLRDFQVGRQADDTAAVVMRRAPTAPPSP